jgi:hypothetical protein
LKGRHRSAAVATAAVATLIAGGAVAAPLHLYSYDPADAATRQTAGALTFEVRKGLLHTTVINLRSTEASATAELRPADGRALGQGGIDAVVGPKGAEKDLYEVRRTDEGAELISALCPGAARAWLAFSHVRLDRDLEVAVIGQAAGARPHLCHVLAYNFHGEWRAPSTGPALHEKDLPHGRFPGT